jgi:hypothetical protein
VKDEAVCFHWLRYVTVRKPLRRATLPGNDRFKLRPHGGSRSQPLLGSERMDYAPNRVELRSATVALAPLVDERNDRSRLLTTECEALARGDG